MTALEILEEGLRETKIPYAEERYYGKDKTKYLTYIEEDSRDGDFADNRPQSTETWYQLHYFCPSRPKEADDSRKNVKLIKTALRKRGFCFEGTARLTEENDRRHVIMNCSIKTMEV